MGKYNKYVYLQFVKNATGSLVLIVGKPNSWYRVSSTADKLFTNLVCYRMKVDSLLKEIDNIAYEDRFGVSKVVFELERNEPHPIPYIKGKEKRLYSKFPNKRQSEIIEDKYRNRVTVNVKELKEQLLKHTFTVKDERPNEKDLVGYIDC